MANIEVPENLNWLLDFVNLGCTPGKLNLPRQIRFYTQGLKLESLPFSIKPGMKALVKTPKHVKVKRPPIEPSMIKKDINPSLMPLVKFVGNITKGDCMFHVTPNGEIVVAGKHDFFPKIEDFKSFFSEHGILPEKTTKHLYLKGDMDSIIPEDAVESSIKRAVSKGANMPIAHKEAYIYLKTFSQIVLCFFWDIMKKGS